MSHGAADELSSNQIMNRAAVLYARVFHHKKAKGDTQ
jgi:hypothetical protein